MPQTKLADCEGQLSALKDARADQDETLSDLEEDLKKQKQRYDELTVQNESLRKEAQAEHERNIEEEKTIKELEAQVKALQEGEGLATTVTTPSRSRGLTFAALPLPQLQGVSAGFLNPNPHPHAMPLTIPLTDERRLGAHGGGHRRALCRAGPRTGPTP